jgi:glycosyltransferase involved in cell wall biosynthesis
MLELTFYLIVTVQVFFYLFFFSRFAFSKIEKKTINTESISVIICAKNEAENLKQFLPYIIKQNYFDFEIILVNDNSTDKTLEVMQLFEKKSNKIKIVNLFNNSSNKKNAVTQGVEAAKHEYLLFTDADCKPASNNWISEMSSHFSAKKQLILGYGAYQKNNNSWLNKLIRFETVLTAIQYFSYAKVKLTYMGVGRNLAYTKSLFRKANGFESHQHIKSGDDDLFINQIANKNNVGCCYSEDSFTVSKPHINFKKWLYQKRRHISTATTYKPIHQFLLGVFFISQFLFWTLGIYLMIFSPFKNIIVILFSIRIIMQYIIYGFSSVKLKENDLILFLPFLELFLILIQIRIFMQNLIAKPTNW